MSVRITTNGLFRNYRSNLYKNTNKLNTAMMRVQTQRNFNSYAEDPAAANRAFQLRRSFQRVGDQLDNSNYVISKFQSAWSALDGIIEGNDVEGGGLNGVADSLRALNDTNAGARTALGQSLVSSSDSIVRMLNVQYGDDFVFAGDDGLNVPFEWSGETLLYRGIDVNAPKPLSEDEFDALNGDFEDYPEFEDWLDEKSIDDASATFDNFKAWYYDRYQETSSYSEESLGTTEDMCIDRFYNKASVRYNDATYVDIGIGLQLDSSGEVIPTSAFNASLSGLTYLGGSRDEDGESRNVAVLMKELGTLFSSCDPESGAYQEYTFNGVHYTADEAAERSSLLAGKVQDGIGAMIEQHTKLTSSVTYLESNVDQLIITKDQMNEQIVDVEQMDSALAITEMMWAQYSYNAALRIGTNILSQSLIDYLS